jgi:hypothetical protein
MNNKTHLIQLLDGLWTPALEDYYQGLKISIEACSGEFHEFVAQSHGLLACAYECYAEDSISSWEVVRERRVARFGRVGGQMGEDLPLNNYMKCVEHYLACGVSYACHLVNICKSNPDEIITAKHLDTICENISMLKPLHVTKMKNCLNALDLPFMTPKKS